MAKFIRVTSRINNKSGSSFINIDQIIDVSPSHSEHYATTITFTNNENMRVVETAQKISEKLDVL